MTQAAALRAAFGSQSDRLRASFGGSAGLQSFASDLSAYRKVGAKVSKNSMRALENTARRGERLAAIVADDGAMKAVMEWASVVAPAFVEAVSEHFVPMADRVRNSWPRATGRSGDSLVFAVLPEGDNQISANFEGLAPYTLFVKYPMPKRERTLSDFEKRVEGAIRQSREQRGVADYTEIARRFGLTDRPNVNAYMQSLDRTGARLRSLAPMAGPSPTGIAEKPGAGVWATQARKPFRSVVDQVFNRMVANLDKAVE